MNIIILGMPGSGKGTQAEKISKEFGLFYLQTGSLSRAWAESDPRIKEIVQSGGLIPEVEMTEHVFKFLEEKVPEGVNILFEGFPRYIDQYEKLADWLSKKGTKIDVAIYLKINEEIVVERISSRRICDKCGEVFNLVTNPPKNTDICDKCGGNLGQRKDDNPEAIRTRFRYYRDNTGKLVDYLRDKGLLWEVDADREIETIFKEIKNKLEDFK